MWRIFLTVSLLCWSADGQGNCRTNNRQVIRDNNNRPVACRDNNNRPVDWYIIYKVPKLNNIGTTGLEYIYIDSEDQTIETYKEHDNKLINHPNGVLANTLRPIFTTSMTDNFGFISYSDQPPGCNAFATFGHSKGVVMMEKDQTGVWLSHSVPQFPFKRDPEKFWPRSGAKNAQTFICVTFNYEEFQQIGQHLLDIVAFPFDHHIPPGFYNRLKQVTEKDLVERPPRNRNQIKIQALTSAGLTGTGTSFESIAKRQIKVRKAKKTPYDSSVCRRKIPEHTTPEKKIKFADSSVCRRNIPVCRRKIFPDNIPEEGEECDDDAEEEEAEVDDSEKIDKNSEDRFDGDLYQTIADHYGTNVKVQTWCSKNEAYRIRGPQVIRIASLKADLGNEEVNWEAGNDHSKWCVAADDDNNNKHKYLICIADVNRGLSQYQRPGGALCFKHQQASRLFKGLIQLEGNRNIRTKRNTRDTDSDCDPEDTDSISEPGDTVSVSDPGDSVSDPGDSVYDSFSDSDSGGFRDVIVNIPQAPWYYLKRVKVKRS
uniref:deoxyribonuclease II n=1 Tax=Sander lucioperca TaxID=283035 RepID=A0A8D0AJ26_SANLU